MMSPIGKNKLRGFTLTELLLSVVILSFGLVAIIGSYLNSANVLDSSQNRLAAIEWLKEKLSLLEQTAKEQGGLEPGSSEEEVKLNNRQASYSLEISELPALGDLDLSDKLNTVKLSLSWKERNIDKDAAVFTYLEKKQQQ